MDFLINAQVLGSIYAKSFLKTIKLSKKYWWVLFTFFVYFALVYIFGRVASILGIIGGLLMALVFDACVSSFLVMVDSMIKDQKIRFEDFKKSFWVYFFDVIGVMFIYWIGQLLVSMVARNTGYWLTVAYPITIFILFNPLPELICQGHRGSMDLYSKAYAFITSNWIEWFVPNLIVGGLLWFIFEIALPPFSFAWFAQWILVCFFVYFFMIFRGLLFQELHRSSRRARIFQYKSRGS